MTPLLFTLCAFLIAVVAGLLGSLVGIGGGIIMVPALTLIFGIDMRYAIGASIVSVIATSSGAAAAYVRERMTNLRVAMFLEIATTTGALTGAYVAGKVSKRWLFIIFGAMLGYSAIVMVRKRHEHDQANRPKDRIADHLRLHDSYYDEAIDRQIHYRVARTPIGFALMWLAGLTSGLLGIGSGALKVPAMDLA